MNRTDVLDALTRAGVGDPALALDVILEVISAGLASGDGVAFRNFGRFESKERKPVIKKIPGTDRQIKIKAQKWVRFTPSLALKRRINR